MPRCWRELSAHGSSCFEYLKDIDIDYRLRELMRGIFIHFVSAWLIGTDERRVLIRCDVNVAAENVLMAVNSLVVFEMVTSDPWETAVMSHAAVGSSCSSEAHRRLNASFLWCLQSSETLLTVMLSHSLPKTRFFNRIWRLLRRLHICFFSGFQHHRASNNQDENVRSEKNTRGFFRLLNSQTAVYRIIDTLFPVKFNV